MLHSPSSKKLGDSLNDTGGNSSHDIRDIDRAIKEHRFTLLFDCDGDSKDFGSSFGVVGNVEPPIGLAKDSALGKDGLNNLVVGILASVVLDTDGNFDDGCGFAWKVDMGKISTADGWSIAWKVCSGSNTVDINTDGVRVVDLNIGKEIDAQGGIPLVQSELGHTIDTKILDGGLFEDSKGDNNKDDDNQQQHHEDTACDTSTGRLYAREAWKPVARRPLGFDVRDLVRLGGAVDVVVAGNTLLVAITIMWMLLVLGVLWVLWVGGRGFRVVVIRNLGKRFGAVRAIHSI